MAIAVNNQITIPDQELQFSFSRSGGPGGQNVNKVNSRATMRWCPDQSGAIPEDVLQRFLTRYRHRLTKDGELILNSQRYRDQGRNMEDCCRRLAEMINSVFEAPVKRRPTKPSRGANARRLNDKKEQAQRKQSRKRPRMDD
ncbi:MAG: aminoacyl-tRNA hydrolase [Planctomycetaceae bacterium]|nr:aminoacyl-tRNA hydrolase [Planctomycetaceae bacterium]